MAEDAPQDGKPAAKWLTMLSEAEVADRTYQDKCDSIDKLYSDLEELSKQRKDRQFQIFWANLGILLPTMYSRAPVPLASERQRDRKPVVRAAADLLERALQADVEEDELHDTLMLARDDLGVNARGVVWLRYGERDGADYPLAEHIDRKDFRHGPARKWQEVPWVARRAWMTREEVEERFGEAPQGMTFSEQKVNQQTTEKKAAVWEMWHKASKCVYWLSPGVTDVLDKKDAWLKLKGFYPCPRPAYGTVKRGTLTPVPDFVYYKDQVEEINELTARVSSLSESLRLRGFYAAGNQDFGDAFETALKQADNAAILVPVNSLAVLGPGAKLSDVVLWLPVREVAEVIAALIELRKQLIQDVYEITGLSDIMRGATDAQETLGAQELKSQYGSIRVKERQAEMARLARDVIRLKAEVMAENMPIEQIMAMAQVDDIPHDAEIAQQVQQIKTQAMQQIEAIAIQAMQQPPQQPVMQ